MRKLIMLIFIIGFLGSASAAGEIYHFTAEISVYSDGAEIFSELGYSANMPLKGTIMIDPELDPMKTYPDPYDPYVPYAFGWWDTGLIMFENQGYSWLSTCGRNLLVQNSLSDHMIRIWTKQGNPIANPDEPEMVQMITLTNSGLDASMPDILNVGDSPVYTLQIKKDGLFSVIKANITSIMNPETTPNATALVACPCDNDWKNHGAYVKCVAQYANQLMADGHIGGQEKGAIVSSAAKSECGKKN